MSQQHLAPAHKENPGTLGSKDKFLQGPQGITNHLTQTLPPADLSLNFEKSSLTNWILSLQKSISKSIFVGYTGGKNPV